MSTVVATATSSASMPRTAARLSTLYRAYLASYPSSKPDCLGSKASTSMVEQEQ